MMCGYTREKYNVLMVDFGKILDILVNTPILRAILLLVCEMWRSHLKFLSRITPRNVAWLTHSII
jgi:hypothetical protein